MDHEDTVWPNLNIRPAEKVAPALGYNFKRRLAEWRVEPQKRLWGYARRTMRRHVVGYA
jgi:hypothetical protein